jgi:hypothetical protein
MPEEPERNVERRRHWTLTRGVTLVTRVRTGRPGRNLS